MKQSYNVALILAGGIGERMHAVVPKQFMEIDGEMVLLHTLRRVQRRLRIALTRVRSHIAELATTRAVQVLQAMQTSPLVVL